MNFSGLLSSIENDVDEGRFKVDDISGALLDLAGEDVKMEDAAGAGAAHGGLEQVCKREVVDESRDVEMEDAPLDEENIDDEVVADKDTQEKSEEPNYLFNPTKLGEKVATELVLFSKQHEDEEPSSRTAEQPEMEKEHEPEEQYRTEVLRKEDTYSHPTYTAKLSTTHLYLASTYIQLAFNTAIASIFLYIISSILLTFWRDVDRKLDAYAASMLTEAQRCTRKYLENDCRPDLRAPALDVQCEQWEKCMDQDVLSVGRLRVSAEVIAEIINAFVEPFTTKTVVMLIATVGAAFALNFAFGFFRAYNYQKSSVH